MNTIIVFLVCGLLALNVGIAHGQENAAASSTETASPSAKRFPTAIKKLEDEMNISIEPSELPIFMTVTIGVLSPEETERRIKDLTAASDQDRTVGKELQRFEKILKHYRHRFIWTYQKKEVDIVFVSFKRLGFPIEVYAEKFIPYPTMSQRILAMGFEPCSAEVAAMIALSLPKPTLPVYSSMEPVKGIEGGEQFVTPLFFTDDSGNRTVIMRQLDRFIHDPDVFDPFSNSPLGVLVVKPRKR